MFSRWRKIFGSRNTNQVGSTAGTSALSNDRNTLVISKRGYTYIQVVKFNFTWTISDFSFCHEKTGEALKSPEFSMADGPKWFLLVYPNGTHDECSDHVALFLHLGSPATLKVKYSLSLMPKGGQIAKSRPRNEQIFDRRSNSWGFRRFVARDVLLDKKNGLLPDDSLTIFCEIETCLDRKSNIVEDEPNADAALQSADAGLTQFRVPECDLSDDLKRLLDCPPEQCDVILVTTGGERIYAHKVVLTARSPVFAAMFEHEMSERKWNRVNIADIEPAVLRGMLEYIYTGQKPTKLEEIAEGLLAAADKYDLRRLKVICEEGLAGKISAEHVADILILADLHSAESLKQLAMNFVNKYGQSTNLFETESWTNLVSRYPHLVNEALNLSQQ